MSYQIILEDGCGQEVGLDLIVECNLANGHENATSRSCCYAGEEIFETLMTIYPNQAIYTVLIAERRWGEVLEKTRS